MPARVLLVGGAGYIGSVCGAKLLAAGHSVTTFDDLSTGHRAAAQGELIVGDLRDRGAVRDALRAGPFDCVMHFAARSLVGESVQHPLRYYDTNTGGTATLLAAMAEEGVRRLVFSSTCAVYGNPQYLPLDEAHPMVPVSPYGDSKRMIEGMLDAVRSREGFGVTSLRYFNAAGATLDGRLGEAHGVETHLIPLALAAAFGKRPPLALFGQDYPTRDGTCVRDYVHVEDLAEAHRLAMQRLLDGDPGLACNLGTGRGTTVAEVLQSVERVTQKAVPHRLAPRREGDPPELYAAADRARTELGWTPRFTEIDEIVASAARWARAPRY
jgi:UDP-glucose-4-epimerase GalE